MAKTNRGEDWIGEVVRFWFEELTSKDWFTVKPETDAAIRRRFLDLHARISHSVPHEAYESGRAALAAIIVLDQFPRNLFRSSAQAFASDGLAIDIARHAVDTGLDTELTDAQKAFLYMPFMHSEVLAEQERGVVLFRARQDQDNVKFALHHRDIVARFGRFPHRNRALGRESTEAESEFLKTHKSFGQ